MGRHALKDREKVLDGCTKLFWKQGFSNTSIKDIEAATQLKNGSIYYFFTNKTNLFEQTLDHYFEKVIQQRVKKYLLTDCGDAYDNIRNLFLSALSSKPNHRQGCLAVNTTIESHINLAIQNKLKIINETLEDGFLYQLKRIPDLEKKPDKELRIMAHLLTLCNHGFFCMMRLGNSDKALRQHIESITSIIKRQY